MKRLRLTLISFALLLISMLSLPISVCSADTTISLEYKLKAAFIYNFIKFTKWPEPAETTSDNNPLIVCVAGENPFGDALEPLSHKKVAGRQIVLADAPRAVDLKNVEDCHVVFVAESAASTQFIQALSQQQTLTISDEVGFARRGGCIELREHNGKIRFIINRTTLEQQGLELSYQVYALALEVIDAQQD